jgi:CRISPR/Cas system-associated exonuclease Cas4 (RecB family)
MTETSALPKCFQFSQARLQDYVDCPRRFQLRHLLMQPWPALIAEPAIEAEQDRQRGANFHRLVQQHTSGVDTDRLEEAIRDPILLQWWHAFLVHPPADLPEAVRRAELLVAAPLAGFRFVAKIDLLAADPGHRVVVVDWKTLRRVPPRPTLADQLQTLIYRYLAVEAGTTHFGGLRPGPRQVEMVYWFANAPEETQRFGYDQQQHNATRQYLADLVHEIQTTHASIWPLTDDGRQCRFCKYRSLCDRGVQAGFLDDLEFDLEPDEPEIDLEQIAEIEF